MAPNTTTPVGTLQVIMAIGTDQQIAHLKKSRSLSPCRSFLRSPPARLPLPVLDNSLYTNGTQIENPPNEVLNAEQNLATPTADRQTNLAAMLSNFIDNLASRLPERSNNINTNTNMTQNIPPTTIASATTPQNQHLIEPMASAKALGGPQIRATSDLLDELQRALTVAPPSSMSSLSSSSSSSMMMKPATSHFNQVCDRRLCGQ